MTDQDHGQISADEPGAGIPAESADDAANLDGADEDDVEGHAFGTVRFQPDEDEMFGEDRFRQQTR